MDPQRNLLIDMGFLQTARHVSRLMKLGLGRGFHIQSHAVDGMKIGLEPRFKVKRGEPVVRDSLGEALEEYAPIVPQKKEFCLRMGTLKLIYRLLLPKGLKPVIVRPAKRV